MLEHFVYCIKKQACSEKDAQYLINQCVINFKSTDLEQNHIKNYLKDALKRALSGVSDAATPRMSDSLTDSKEMKSLGNNVAKKAD